MDGNVTGDYNLYRQITPLNLGVQSGGNNGASGASASSSSASINPFAARGSAWEGFTVPPNNGTGQVIPVHAGREDEIVGLEYFA